MLDMFDSHCHLDASEYDADRREVLDRARASGMRGIFVPGFEPSEWRTLSAFCAQDSLLCFGLGLHPWYVKALSQSALELALAELPELVRTTRCVAIGECGLDAIHAKRGGASMEVQQHVLAAHLALAHGTELPIVLHCVGAHGMLLAMLEARGALPGGGVMHSYSGPAELVPRYQELGLSFSFAGIVARPEAQRPRRALAAVPIDRLLVESDGPDQPIRELGTRSEPAHVRRVLEIAAELRGEPYSQLVRETTDNALRLLGSP